MLQSMEETNQDNMKADLKETKEEIITETEEDMEERKISLGDFCEEAASLLLMAYMFILFCLYPFYMKNGYVEIGSAKFSFYRDITIGAFCLIVPIAIIAVGCRVKKNKKLEMPKLSFIDVAVALYGISVVVSYLFSEFKWAAVWGERGWNLGVVTQLLFVVSYFLISRFWEYEENILYAFMAAAIGVFGMGILNRFSIFPIAIEGAHSSFISTLGNINWYCGYFSVLFPIGFCLYWFTNVKWQKAVAAVFTVVGIATGVSQGSSSAFIVFVGIYLFLFCLSFSSIGKMKRFFELIILFCLTCQGLRIWRLLIPDAFDYYSGTLSDWITMSRATLFVLVPAVIIYILLLLVDRKKTMDIHNYKILRQILLLFVVITIGVYVMLLFINSGIQSGIRFMGNQAALNFTEYWGSSRGGTWMAGIDIFRRMNGVDKLIGVGPDCFATYLYTLPDVTKRVLDQFGEARLTNAHNESLTVLVNNGFLGLISYTSIFIGAIIRFINKAEKEKKVFLFIFAISTFSYMIHNIVSFQQILSTPFIFIMIGMGEQLARKEHE